MKQTAGRKCGDKGKEPSWQQQHDVAYTACVFTLLTWLFKVYNIFRNMGSGHRQPFTGLKGC